MALNSINTNSGAMIALQNLNTTSQQLQVTQQRINTGKKIASGKLSPAKYAKMEATEPTKMARGGGVESKGKTKGKMIVMKRGGKSC